MGLQSNVRANAKFVANLGLVLALIYKHRRAVYRMLERRATFVAGLRRLTMLSRQGRIALAQQILERPPPNSDPGCPKHLVHVKRWHCAIEAEGCRYVEDPSVTARRRYVSLMRSVPISVSTKELRYTAPGFAAGTNFLAFRTECVEAVGRLMESATERRAMAEANREYYLSRLRPDRPMTTALALQGLGIAPA